MAMMTTSLPQAPFYMYSGPAFPSADALLSCNRVKKLAAFEEPMAQFYAEIGLYRSLASHRLRVSDPAAAELFFVPLLPHLDADASGCNGTNHKTRMAAVATALRASPHWQRRNGSDHFWACTCVMMRGMLSPELWSMLANAVHSVHSVPRGHASPSRCTMAIPYQNPSFANSLEAPSWRVPGIHRPILAHFRGRVMNRVRSGLVKQYGRLPAHMIEAAHPSTAARCNLNKCSSKAKAKNHFPSQRVHFEEMKRSTFCLVPAGDSPPSSRLYLAIAAGCVPVIISNGFRGAFASAVPWHTFSLRVPETDVASTGRRRGGASRSSAAAAAGPAVAFNLTSHLLSIVAKPGALLALQQALQAHAADVLWEAPGSRAGDHALGLATLAIRKLCADGASPSLDPALTAAMDAPQPQIHFAAREAAPS